MRFSEFSFIFWKKNSHKMVKMRYDFYAANQNEVKCISFRRKIISHLKRFTEWVEPIEYARTFINLRIVQTISIDSFSMCHFQLFYKPFPLVLWPQPLCLCFAHSYHMSIILKAVWFLYLYLYLYWIIISKWIDLLFFLSNSWWLKLIYLQLNNAMVVQLISDAIQ